MANVAALLSRKEPVVHTIAPSASALDAAQVMNRHRIGSLVVTQDEGKVVGILTERDILVRIVAAGRDPRTTRVEEVMTRDVLCCSPTTTYDELRSLMRRHRIRHVPVAEGGRLIGLVSIGDLNAVVTEGMSATIAYLEEYICRG